MLQPDTILQGRYRVVRQLGQGGMGAVYEAIDERLDTTVALKQTFFTDERLKKQFEREARLLARLHHPALPRVSDHFAEGDGEFLVMQFIAGDDLAEMMAQRRGPFPPDQVLTWTDQLLDALDYLHTQEPQIVHRDIKPQNLKLTTRGQVILLDFGLAKGQAGELSRITTSASIFGYTPNYAPLEQIQGLGTDARSDIYSLAATVYHLITAVKPPDALSRAASLVNGQPDPLQHASEVSSAIGKQVGDVLQRAMAQNRDQRFRSADEMRKALSSTEEAATLTSRGEAATVLFPPQGKAIPTQVAGQNTVDKQPTKLTGETTVLREPVSKTRRMSPWLIATAAMALLCIGFGAFYALQRRNDLTPINQLSTSPSSNVQPAPTASPGSEQNEDEKAAGEEKKAAAIEKQATRAARAAERKAVTAKKENKDEDEADTRHNKAEVEEPDVPDPDVPGPPPRRPKVKRVGGVTIRNFPDGSQLITTPDGNSVLVTRDGKRRFFRRGERVERPRER